jgi:predicted ATP-grasp superfamily ATP-dependent carboligase
MLSETKGAIIIEGHVQGLANTRSLGKLGIPVIVLDKGPCVAASSKYCSAFFTCPDYKSAEFIDFLIKLGKDKKLKDWVLIPSNDHIVFNISQNLDLVQSIYKTSIPEEIVLDKIYNKANLLSLADKINVPIPRTVYLSVNDLAKDLNISYPVLTKGKQGLDFYKTLGRKVFLANNEQELKNQLKEISSVFPLENTFTQELIPYDGTNKTVSLAAFAIDGEIKSYWMGVKLREHPLQFGTATFTESVFEADCLKSAKILLKELNYTGVCEIEFLKDPRDKQFKLIEINARTWLWVGHAIANGINFPLFLFNFLNQIDQEYPEKYKTGIKWKNPFSDTIFSLIGLLKRYYSIKSLRDQNKGETINALWDKNDFRPWFRYAVLMFNFLKTR